eukprot:TRINITY_DN6437_c0_g1_i3.p1 TRINITY_DN6437_c0_g1~~TRINITY_DN6437_c0_g1_i3.p1  ORF type:complete len:1213 (+),score=173.22 TRINITY_DN6437_c0_g1_i3:71-3709(+)
MAQILAPSLRFLRKQSRSEQKVAFLSEDYGFLPSTDLPPLPAPYSIWEDVARKLPEMRVNQDYKEIDTIPLLPSDGLLDEHLLRANIALGAIAHCQIHYGGSTNISPMILEPWKQIGKRLGRPSASFGSLDYFLYNIQRKKTSNQNSSRRSSTHDDDTDNPFESCEPIIQLSGGICERNFILSCYSIEWKSRLMLGAAARAQDYILKNDVPKLMQELNLILEQIENAHNAFTTSDPRPLCNTYVDPVEWGRTIGTVGTPVLPGEKTISGLLFPVISLLDTFFGRSLYESPMGKLALIDKKWLPSVHTEFLQLLSQVSLRDYVQTTRFQPLSEIYKKLLATYLADDGLLGRHRLKIYGILELSMKVGRATTAAGSVNQTWRRRVWLELNEHMALGIKERESSLALQDCSSDYVNLEIKQVRQILRESSLYEVTFSLANSGLVYFPGDRISILPQHSDQVIRNILDELDLKEEEQEYLIKLNPEWIRHLKENKIVGVNKEGDVYLPIYLFLKHAEIRPLQKVVCEKMIQAMYNCHPVLLAQVSKSTNMDMIGLIALLKATSYVSIHHQLLPNLANIIPPLKPRMYSISSAPVLNEWHCPTSLTITIQRISYLSLGFYSLKEGGSRDSLEKSNNDKQASLANGGQSSLKLVNSKQYMMQEDALVNEVKKKFEELPPEKLSIIKRVCEILLRKNNSTSKRLGYLGKQIVLYSRLIKSSPSLQKNNQGQAGILTMNGCCTDLLSGAPSHPIPAKIVPALHFRMPSDSKTPIVMFALGSGAGPFMSFIHEAANTSRSGELYLFWGVKNRASLFKWEEFWRPMIENKVINCSIAFSQEAVDLQVSEQKIFFDSNPNGSSFQMYTTRKIVEFVPGSQKRLGSLFDLRNTTSQRHITLLHQLLDRGAAVYLCGQPHLDRLVNTIINNNLSAFDANSKYTVQKLYADGRYHLDLFYSGVYEDNEKEFYISEIARHNHANSCWVIFRGHVYDITEYLHSHPGGNKLLIDKGGRDFTNDFNASHGEKNDRVVHMLKAYKIGRVKEFEGESRMRMLYQFCRECLWDILEFRSAFDLSLNNYPGEPKDFVPFSAEEKYRGVLHEHFIKKSLKMIVEYIKDEMMKKWVSLIDEIYDGRLIANDNFVKEVEKSYQERAEAEQGEEKKDKKEVERMLEEDGRFMKDLVEFFIGVVLIVESREDDKSPDEAVKLIVDKFGTQLPKVWSKN